PAESIPARELYEAFTAWCEDTGEKACSQRAFGVRLSERGLVRGRSHTGGRVWEGLALMREQAS
ncbi:MAG TPA: primase-like DNA-binding domain-containing protein, partial [Armatimonadota bacterium]|nr:primase-like DNA-binding domain-containing protein [Armatimonadota bacterium]